jgi:hypothetical protein
MEEKVGTECQNLEDSFLNVKENGWMVHLEGKEDIYLEVKGNGGPGHLELWENMNVNMEEIDLDSLDLEREG